MPSGDGKGNQRKGVPLSLCALTGVVPKEIKVGGD